MKTMKILLGIILLMVCTWVQTLAQDDQTEEPTEEATEVAMDEEEPKGAMEKCTEVMANNGLNFSSFWHGAAHGIHSLGLEEIRHFFEPEAPEQNRIPVVNANLSAEQTILFHSPLRGYDEDFKTMALKVMAFFMLHDKPNFFQQGVNTLEKVTHQYHMHEIYAAAVPIYKKMKEDPPADKELCPCVNDVTGNGILTEVVNIAKQLKYFARQPRSRCLGATRASSQAYDTYQNTYNSNCGGSTGFQYGQSNRFDYNPQRFNYGGWRRSRRHGRSVKNTSEIIAKYEKEYLADSSHENAQKLMHVNPWKPNTLVGPDQWISYEAMLTWSMLEEEELNDFAVFMYCKLNQPDLDHPKDLFD